MDLNILSQDIDISWQKVFNTWASSPDFKTLSTFLEAESKTCEIYPKDPFVVFKKLRLQDVKVVILGQDPYHGQGQAHGLAFSVEKDQKTPPSLKNIFKEINRTEKCEFKHGNLTAWVDQGVLLLNTTLTVSKGMPASHSKKGWESLTDLVIREISTTAQLSGQKTVFLLWGAHAQAKELLIDKNDNVLVLKANHPSPFSALRPPIPFIGCGHFQKVREFGVRINWSAPV